MFSRLAPVYELWAWWVERAPRRRVLELACVKDSETVLEVATGTGVQFVALGRQNRSGRTVGVDFAPGMALAEFHRVLKPGGRLVVTNMTRGVSGTTAYGTRSTHAASTSS
jgi:ubiquinone/menaquinone biosynthesis C-methylase UbiE